MNASRADFQEATQKVKNKKKHNDKTRIQQGSPADVPEPNKIAASTHYDFKGKNLTPYGGLFPVATMLEKLDFRKLVAEALTVKRIPRVMTIYQFVLGMVLALYVGFARLNHIRFVAQDPMLTGILKVCELPGQSTFWRFLASLNLNVAGQLLQLQRILRERVWEAANVRLKSITLDTDTTVHTVYGQQMGARKGYNPKNKGKKSFQPILTFLAETREYVWGELRNGDRPDGKQIARHLQSVFAALPRCIQTSSRGPIPVSIVGRRCKPTKKPRRTSSSWRARRRVCWNNCKTPIGSPRARPTPMSSANSAISRKVGARPTALSLCAMRRRREKNTQKREQYQLFDTPEYSYRVFVTDMDQPIDLLVWFYRQRAGAENLIKEANNDAGLAAHPSGRWATNCVHFQLVMLAYNLNCWLLLFQREEGVPAEELQHTRLATARLRFLFVAAKIWKHSGRVGISYSDQYAERGLFQRLMERLREIAKGPASFLPVLARPLTC